MLCASVPLWDVSVHLNRTLGIEDDAPVTVRKDCSVSALESLFIVEGDGGEPTDSVFLLTLLKQAA
jgi:hypothetical protein